MFGRGFYFRTDLGGGAAADGAKTPTQLHTRSVRETWRRSDRGRLASADNITFRVSRSRFSRTARKINNHALAASHSFRGDIRAPALFRRRGPLKRKTEQNGKSRMYKCPRVRAYRPRSRADIGNMKSVDRCSSSACEIIESTRDCVNMF